MLLNWEFYILLVCLIDRITKIYKITLLSIYYNSKQYKK